MNSLQQTEFNILKEYVRICDELELTYFLVCGSALGAAKYKGFIPWDDDIDVGMPREDYDIFCAKAQEMLPEHLFLQNYQTDKYYPLIFSKIRNCNTTFIEKSYATSNINHGIYIDVFPLDGYPENERLKAKIEREKKRYLLTRLCCLDVPHSWKAALLVTAQRLFGIHKNPRKFVERFVKQIKQYPTSKSPVWCNHGNWQAKLEYAPKEQYGEGIFTDFEGLQVRIPEMYDEYLTQKYGDWRADPPESEKEGHHYHFICDTRRSYKDYIEEESDRKINIKKGV